MTSCISPTNNSTWGIQEGTEDEKNDGGSRNIDRSLSGANEQLVGGGGSGGGSGVGPLSLSHSATVAAKLEGPSGKICEILN